MGKKKDKLRTNLEVRQKNTKVSQKREIEKILDMKNIVIDILNVSEISGILDKLQIEAKPNWGKLTPQYMVEHLSATIRYSNGKVRHNLLTPEKHLEKYRAVLFADEDFPKFFKSPVFEKDLPKLNNANIAEAKHELIKEIEAFRTYFEKRPGIKEIHAIFGELNYEEWLIYHNKHFQHHFKQFNLLENMKGN